MINHYLMRHFAWLKKEILGIIIGFAIIICILTFLNYLLYLIFGKIFGPEISAIIFLIIAIFYASYKWTTDDIIPYMRKKLRERQERKAGIHFHFHKH